MVKKGEYLDFAKNLKIEEDEDGVGNYNTEMSIIIELAQKLDLLEKEIEDLKKKVG